MTPQKIDVSRTEQLPPTLVHEQSVFTILREKITAEVPRKTVASLPLATVNFALVTFVDRVLGVSLRKQVPVFFRVVRKLGNKYEVRRKRPSCPTTSHPQSEIPG